ncbi:MAG: NADH-quinone oxidoreductase subunit NuoN [Nitrospinaceae bacterium]|nr:NADH-quinone oxidoreductase subunit N [Nitrospinaceae bacterium]NIR56303.1 NADH-quinone oxidoreductase subunit N [Nitrospinaceae bacterium]NIS86760.1 NADH-quinone oxidoreductase subunit N [Nitrospinaceae bacterium]NIT83595.1 NADH-quinone oxidoreductase subunit N [Nitrospinaceae bacterium]NIU45797.1 NADH-quinone oxidoreductase subunit N [Nitrospinaceae bacterium]
MELITPPEVDLVSLAPVLVLSVFTLIVMVTDLFIGKAKTGLVFISLTGLLMAAISIFAKTEWPVYSFGGSYVVDHLSVFFTLIFCVSSALAILVSVEYNQRENIQVGEYYSLILFCTVGMIILASSTDLIMIFLGIEIVSLCLYVLAGIRRSDPRSNEASLKYFLLGAFATGFLLYGMTLIYGTTGTTKLNTIAQLLNDGEVLSQPLMLMGVVLLVLGFGFKVASVPFHMWAPDVYQGAPTPVTAFMAVGPKAAAFAAFFRVFAEAMPELAPSWEMILSIVAVISMFVGNLGAILQTNIKRLLAYSSISHAGYILIAVIAKNSLGSSALIFYMLAYAFMTFGAFGIVILLGHKGRENLELEDYSGLAFQSPMLAMCMSIFLLSLGGLPPLAGFVAKFYVFQAALNEGYVVLVVLAVLNSAISFYYYLKVIVFMYMKEPKETLTVTLTPITLLVIVIGVLGTLELGLFPGPVISLAQH